MTHVLLREAAVDDRVEGDAVVTNCRQTRAKTQQKYNGTSQSGGANTHTNISFSAISLRTGTTSDPSPTFCFGDDGGS